MHATSPGPQLGRIAQVAILVKDLDAAVTFYRDKLGLKHLFTAPGMAFFDVGGTRLMLGQSTEQYPASTFLYYQVDDIEAAARMLTNRGVIQLEAPELAHRAPGMELWLAQFKDLDGNVVFLMCEKKVPA